MGPEGGKTNNDMEEGISMDEELGKKDKNQEEQKEMFRVSEKPSGKKVNAGRAKMQEQTIEPMNKSPLKK